MLDGPNNHRRGHRSCRQPRTLALKECQRGSHTKTAKQIFQRGYLLPQRQPQEAPQSSVTYAYRSDFDGHKTSVGSTH